MPTTLVLGASSNPGRVAYQAIHELKAAREDLILIGLRPDTVAEQRILTPKDDLSQLPPIDTLTLYVGPQNQAFWYDFILDAKPKRVIFNPGTENPELEERLRAANIGVLRACTLVLLTLGQYQTDFD
ncbi:MAG: CoA-binding protein [Bernardetiaceae bacterium]